MQLFEHAYGTAIRDSGGETIGIVRYVTACFAVRNGELAGVAALFAAAVFHPGEEAADAGAFGPHQVEEFARAEIRAGGTEESFHAPLQIGTFPRTEAIALGNHPIIAECVQHTGRRIGVRLRIDEHSSKE